VTEDSDPPSFELLVAAHRAGHVAEAAVGYRRLLDHRPRDPAIQHLLGVCLHQLGQSTAAVELIGGALAARPNDPAIANNLGEALLGCGQVEDALIAFDHAVALDGDVATFRINQAKARGLTGDGWGAIEGLSHAVSLTPRDPAARSMRAEAFLALGEWARGWRDLALAAGADESDRLADRVVIDRIDERTVPAMRWLAALPAGHGVAVADADFAPILAHSFPDLVVTTDPAPDGTPLEALPHLLGLGADAIGDGRAYLGVPAALAQASRTRIDRASGSYGRRRVGLATAGPIDTDLDPKRLLFVALTASAVGHVAQGALDMTPAAATPTTLTAMLSGLDLVIADTDLVAHLAGALGVTTRAYRAATSAWPWPATGVEFAWYAAITLRGAPSSPA
jgi:Flp pilus assembly protein TadD